MRKIIAVSLLIALILFSGCSTYLSNLTAAKHNREIGEQVVFEKEGKTFTAVIRKVDPQSSSSRLTGVRVNIWVKNTGKEAVSLMAYPRLEDKDGNQYPCNGNGIYLNMLNPGGQAAVDATIPVPTDEAAASLSNHAVLYVRFQDTKLIPYEGAWNVNLSRS